MSRNISSVRVFMASDKDWLLIVRTSTFFKSYCLSWVQLQTCWYPYGHFVDSYLFLCSVPSRSLIAHSCQVCHLNARSLPNSPTYDSLPCYAMTCFSVDSSRYCENSASNTIWVTSIKSRMNHPIMSVYKHYDQYSNTSILIYISLTKNHFNKRLSKLNS
jgi:hypothetical protein